MTRHLFGYALLLALVLFVSPWLGSEDVTWDDLHSYLCGEFTIGGHIFVFQRLPRLILGIFAGGALAMVGACYQTVFRNPLVEPYTLGIAGGAAVGAFAALSFGQSLPALPLLGWTQILALAGAGGALMLIWKLSGRRGGASLGMVLAGITLSVICGGLILLFTYFAPPHYLVSFQHWLMGGLDVAGYASMAPLGILLFPTLGYLFLRTPELNQIALSPELARGRGIDVERLGRNLFLAGGIATAGVVSLAGPIGFVGLLVPHAIRRLSGTDARLMLPASFLLGAAVLVVCDTLARTVAAPSELPVGIVTALLGGPCFIAMLYGKAEDKLTGN